MSHSTHDPVNEPRAGPTLCQHESDGIQEYDNPMPLWWSGLFWVTIIFSVGYAMYFSWGVGPSSQQEYQDELGGFYLEQAQKLGDLQPDRATIDSLMHNDKMLKAARGLFLSNCAVCHAADGGGLTGPNLCDGSYLNIKKLEDFYSVISNGVVPKGMPAWDKRFIPAQRVLLAAYVASLRGTTPAAPRAPQGTEVPPWDAK